MRAGPRQPFRYGCPYAAAGTGDERRAAFQTKDAFKTHNLSFEQ